MRTNFKYFSSFQNECSTSPSSPKPLNYTTANNNNCNLLISSLSSLKSLDKNSQISVSTSAIVASSSTFDIHTRMASGLNNNHYNNSNSFIMDHYRSSNLSSEESINHIIKTPQTPHQHFHKKYLRETLKQQDEEKKQQQEQTLIQNAHMSSYIITKNTSDDRYIYSDDREYLTSFNNNNNSVQNFYEKSHEYDLAQKIMDLATPKIKSCSSGSSVASSSSSSPSPKQKQHPNNIPYDPLVHTASKPPYSFR